MTKTTALKSFIDIQYLTLISQTKMPQVCKGLKLDSFHIFMMVESAAEGFGFRIVPRSLFG